MPRRKNEKRANAAEQRAPAHEHEHERAEPRPLWSGTLSFGLVSVPVDVYSETRQAGVALRMLAPDGTPLSRRYVCPEDDVEVSNQDLVRGFETGDGEYVVISDEELEALEPDKSRDIDLQTFVPARAIDPVYFERSFLLAPAGGSLKAYQLLTHVMQASERVGIATFVMREKEYLVAIAARDGLLHAEALRFHDEVRSSAGVGLPKPRKLDHGDVQPFIELIEKHASKAFDPSALRNQAADDLRELAEKKRRKHEDVVESDVEAAEPEDQGARVIDLMQVLKRSLQDQERAKKGAGKRKARAAR